MLVHALRRTAALAEAPLHRTIEAERTDRLPFDYSLQQSRLLLIGPRVRDRVVIRVWLRCAFITGSVRGFGGSCKLRFLSGRHGGRELKGRL